MKNFQQPNNIQMPTIFTELLLNAKYLHCCTIDRHFCPHIVPLIFIFDNDRNLIFCVASGKSAKVHNMRQNHNVTFTTDEIHPNNPLLNTGIMVETVVELSQNDSQIAEIMIKLKEKYDTLDFKLLTTHVFESDILIIAHPLKVVHWRGPFFQRFILSNHKK